jgi:hypothetical protein
MSRKFQYFDGASGEVKESDAGISATVKLDSRLYTPFVHEPTGIAGYSIADVKEKASRHYANEINERLNFHELKQKKPHDGG